MDTTRFDQITFTLASSSTRRQALRSFVGIASAAVVATAVGVESGGARRKGKGKGKGHHKGMGGSGTRLSLRARCTPGQSTCAAGLQCGSPTTRHTCSSTVAGVDAWCCVPPGGRCTECDCCGDYYCGYDDNNVATCMPNPEG